MNYLTELASDLRRKADHANDPNVIANEIMRIARPACISNAKIGAFYAMIEIDAAIYSKLENIEMRNTVFEIIKDKTGITAKLYDRTCIIFNWDEK